MPSSAQSTEILGDVEFRDLHFAYPAENGNPVEVLHGISLRIPAGTSLALVGPTGSGKSTLVSLIPRICDAPPGAVLIDGRPIRDYPLDALRAAVGFVPQETFLFSTTIHDNIAFGVPWRIRIRSWSRRGSRAHS
jgi:ATP-binding cassette subfamily B multidrug efflux pump